MIRFRRSSIDLAGAAPVLLAVWCAVAAPAEAAVPPAATVSERAREVLADPSYQRDLPGVVEQSEAEDEPTVSGPSGVSAAPVLGAVDAAAAIARLVLWILIAVAAVLLVIWLASLLERRRGKPAAPEPGVGGAGEAAADEPAWLPADAARLAAEGRYGEALHVLLLVAIRQLGERSPRGVEPSRTSRELIRLVPLAPDARLAFESLVRMVEVTLFGGLPAGAEEYSRGLVHFQAVTGARA